LLQGCPIPNDPDRVIINLYPVRKRLDVGRLGFSSVTATWLFSVAI